MPNSAERATPSSLGNEGPDPADLDSNGTVNVDDMLILMGAWGSCP